VICVNLNSEVRARGTVLPFDQDSEDEAQMDASLEEPRRWGLFGAPKPERPKKPNAPGIATVMIDAFNITQDRIARSRLAGDPPDVMIARSSPGWGSSSSTAPPSASSSAARPRNGPSPISRR
jgi:NTE family protein